MKKIVLWLFTCIALALLPVCSLNVRAEVKPEIVINSYEISDKVEYGEKTSIYVVFVNESTSVVAENVLVTFSSPNESVIPAYGTSNQFYITSIQPSAAVGVDIPIVLLETASGYGSMKFQLEYTTVEDRLFDNTSQIVFPLNESGSLSIKNINITSNTTVGANSLIGVGYVNGRNEDLKNVKLVIEGEITGANKTVNVGDLYAGQSKYTECYVTYEEVGERNIKIYMTYEDEKGNTFSADGGDYTVVVKNSAADSGQQNLEQTNNEVNNDTQATQNSTEIEKTSQGIDITVLLLAIAGIIVLILIIIILIKGLRRK